jgi:hypothetical protein
MPPHRPTKTNKVSDLDTNADAHHMIAGEPGERVGALSMVFTAREYDTRAIPLTLGRPVAEPIICSTIKSARIDKSRARELSSKRLDDAGDQGAVLEPPCRAVNGPAFRAGDKTAK